MSSVWHLARIEEEIFAATAALFAIYTQQQSVCQPTPILPEGDDDSSGEEDINDDWQTTVACERLHRATAHTLKDKFLDRLSEVLAREKTSKLHLKQSTAKHVAAAAWINPSCQHPTTILLAKNEGLDERDRKLLGGLQTWLRVISMTGRAPSKEKDLLWDSRADKEGLIGYSRLRLELYVSQVSRSKVDVSGLDVDDPSTGPIQRLFQLCETYSNSPSIPTLRETVDLAYELRGADSHQLKKPSFTKVFRAVLMLSQLHATYKCFKTTALSFPKFRSLKCKPVDSPHKVGIEASKFYEQVQSLAKKIRRKQLAKGRHIQRYQGASWLRVHAEMQSLVRLESELKWQQMVHGYIGTSKKPCFLCNDLLQNYVRLSMDSKRTPAFRARKSHGKVYPLWTLPSIPASAASIVGLPIAAALIKTHSYILRVLSAGSVILQPAIAESSVGMSEGDVLFGTTPSKLKREHLAHERSKTARMPAEKPDESDDNFGPKLKTVQVLRIPADGSEPRLVPIAIHVQSLKSKRWIPELGLHIVPDFREYWGAYHVDRKLRCFNIHDQPIKMIEGDYWIYRNENIDLPENEYIKRMLGLDHIDSSRRFYYGDVFMVKYTEHPKTLACEVNSIPNALPPKLIVMLKRVFQHEWDKAYLELQLQIDQDMQEQILKVKTDKEVLYSRMTPIEREIIDSMPSSVLEILAIQLCDDGGLIDTIIRPSDDPDTILIGK
ncbi:hypothetical protein J3E74DRAFT_421759 [Bipolaris maydis]|nr:hypothetical protein J3E74DRAFT_421759 [Bipolaris maydis]